MVLVLTVSSELYDGTSINCWLVVNYEMLTVWMSPITGNTPTQPRRIVIEEDSDNSSSESVDSPRMADDNAEVGSDTSPPTADTPTCSGCLYVHVCKVSSGVSGGRHFMSVYFMIVMKSMFSYKTYLL